MHFCSNCSYLFDISKSSIVNDKKISRVQSSDSETESLTLNDVFKKIEEKDDLTKYTVAFTKDELIKNKKYQKLTDENKQKLNTLFDENIYSGAEFKCNNCNNTKQINETTLLYEVNLDNTTNNKIKNMKENKLMCADQLLPHTQDYVCKNPECATHKNAKLKDAVFYKEKNSYNINYICTVCFYNFPNVIHNS
jgi:hypothetical protein